MMVADRKQIIHDGQVFIWSGKRWTDASGAIAPMGIVVHLNAYISTALENEDAGVVQFEEIVSRARDAREAWQWRRAEHLSRRAVEMKPGNAGALASLCAALRELKRPEEALDASADYVGRATQALLTARAAAMCDLGRWEDAKREVGRALAMGRDSFSFSVVNRIRVVRPDLYEKEQS